MSLPNAVLSRLRGLEPNGQFIASLPHVQSSSGGHYFVKIGTLREAEQYTGEERSLRDMYDAAPLLVPKMIHSGLLDANGDDSNDGSGRPYFISEYKELSSLSDQASAELGKRLGVELHRFKSDKGFGFDVPTYCGATRMRNGWYETWSECFTVKIRDLLQLLRESGSNKKLVEKGEEICAKVIPKLLGKLDIEPVLLHGDLWSGNTGLDVQTGLPIIFDPSSFYGHNEFDLAIARIFGGIPKPFFETYETVMPKTKPTKEYELRGDLYDLFHYLNHAVLFGGGGYASSAERKMDSLLKWFDL